MLPYLLIYPSVGFERLHLSFQCLYFMKVAGGPSNETVDLRFFRFSTVTATESVFGSKGHG